MLKYNEIVMIKEFCIYMYNSKLIQKIKYFLVYVFCFIISYNFFLLMIEGEVDKILYYSYNVIKFIIILI